jgi:hypothetical protein
MDNAIKPSKIRAALGRIRKVVDRQPEIPLTEEQLKKLKKHRRNIIITMIIPTFFFVTTPIIVFRPAKATAEPCQGVTSHFN